MPERIAFNLAILPPDNVMDKVIALNQALGPKFNLNKTDRLPHITLAQGVIDKGHVAVVGHRMAGIAADYSPLDLTVYPVAGPDISLEVEPSGHTLYDLHRRVMADLEEIVTDDAQEADFLDETVRAESVEYVRRFRSQHSDYRYWPHITIGATQRPDGRARIAFTANRLALGRLGDFNTFRQILAEAKLT